MAARNLKIIQFQANLRKYAATVKQEAVEVLVDTAVYAMGELVGETPRDTGTARANWNPSIGAPDLLVKPKRIYDEYAKPISKEEAATIARARAEEVFGVLRGRGSERLPILYISNALNYIDILNAGSSTQAPIAFVETAVQRIEATIAERVK